jgi:hypothetical protein
MCAKNRLDRDQSVPLAAETFTDRALSQGTNEAAAQRDVAGRLNPDRCLAGELTLQAGGKQPH